MRYLPLAFQFGKEDFWAGLRRPRVNLYAYMTLSEMRAWQMGWESACYSAEGRP